MASRKRGWTPVFGQIRCANKKLERRFRFQFKLKSAALADVPKGVARLSDKNPGKNRKPSPVPSNWNWAETGRAAMPEALHRFICPDGGHQFR
jgi:hypothetical protein